MLARVGALCKPGKLWFPCCTAGCSDVCVAHCNSARTAGCIVALLVVEQGVRDQIVVLYAQYSIAVVTYNRILSADVY